MLKIKTLFRHFEKPNIIGRVLNFLFLSPSISCISFTTSLIRDKPNTNMEGMIVIFIVFVNAISINKNTLDNKKAIIMFPINGKPLK